MQETWVWSLLWEDPTRQGATQLTRHNSWSPHALESVLPDKRNHFDKKPEQSFGLCGRGKGWNDLGEWHWNMYNIIYETSRQSRFDARYWMLGAGALGRLRGRVWGGRREEGSGWGTHVYLWWIHFDIWQNQYNIVKLKNKIKKNNKISRRKRKKKPEHHNTGPTHHN